MHVFSIFASFRPAVWMQLNPSSVFPSLPHRNTILTFDPSPTFPVSHTLQSHLFDLPCSPARGQCYPNALSSSASRAPHSYFYNEHCLPKLQHSDSSHVFNYKPKACPCSAHKTILDTSTPSRAL